MSSTLIEIIENIRPRRIRGANSKRNAIKSKRHLTKGCSESDEEYRNQPIKWSQQDEELLFHVVADVSQLLLVYGTDYSLFMNYFPGYSRRQMKRQLQHLEHLRGNDLTRQIQRRQQLRKQSIFEEQIMEVAPDKTISHQLNKPLFGLAEPN